uniref:Mitochondrial import inner membrane translocase subunit TIM22 n=1 Tax=Fibrocapsa japonica TaxID=94617 RepID=A0A7S2UVA1_9STRA|mmetsp:Transcript_15046/g.22201  ORF Transcript_15046/g.22201 Transcript_15046/m.22201 type:complete len:165 (+) Transcript_15046:67-561(+)|eukprot:CAMPEP_0113943796 /NCGR_PEP_ID=MMETSP1339-20121228/27994_1 /TAXON_ID=94617 /ORGANISM="Fibrocapsa japonica" /LENGTH=164 /DNA_ID=CAMNT_0000948757 /DNA_START=45 /DNA_END=539 /DNA_ORIENTATION=+ /assembly_acc=CAM_ASM_000762
MPQQQPWSTIRQTDAGTAPQGNNDLSEAEKDNLPLSERLFTPELGGRATFGAICGAFTGMSCGAVDGWKAARAMSPMALVGAGGTFNVVLADTAKTGVMFAGFYTTYQSVKECTRVLRKEDDLVNSFVASAVSLSPMLLYTPFRNRLPYALMLIGLDVFNDVVS